MSNKAIAPGAKAGAAAPATNSTAAPVHTSAQKAPKANPLHQPTPRRPRDEYTGQGGTYTRDPVTGQRTRVEPAAAPAAAGADDTAAA